MDTLTIDVMRECSERSVAGTISFPDVVGKLVACGIESYHVDLYRREETFYLPSGESHVEQLSLDAYPIAQDFSAQAISEAVRESQQGTITYKEFLSRITAAGTTNYVVYITGKHVVYIGRDGRQHVEHFPKTS